MDNRIRQDLYEMEDIEKTLKDIMGHGGSAMMERAENLDDRKAGLEELVNKHSHDKVCGG